MKDLGVDLIGIAVGLLLAALLVGPVLNIVQLISSWVTRVFTRQAL